MRACNRPCALDPEINRWLWFRGARAFFFGTGVTWTLLGLDPATRWFSYVGLAGILATFLFDSLTERQYSRMRATCEHCKERPE